MTIEQLMKLYCDKKAAINSSHNPIYHDRVKHVKVIRHFIKEKIEEGIICLIYVPTTDQVSDLFTKIIWRQVFDRLANKLVV